MQNANCKMQNERKDLSERLMDFAAAIIKLVVRLNKTPVGRHIGNQLMRAATSTGANYEEACGAESRANFIHKMQVVLKELKESLYWLRLIRKSGLISDEGLLALSTEADELIKIVAKSVITAKGKGE